MEELVGGLKAVGAMLDQLRQDRVEQAGAESNGRLSETQMHKLNVLFLCTGNSARSQMGEAILRKHAGDRFNVYSAGTDPKGVNPLTIKALEEAGIPTADLRSKGVKEYLGKLSVRYLIIVCSEADKACPSIWPGMMTRLFWPFDDPAAATGSDEVRMETFRRVRDQIEAKIKEWLSENS